MLARISLLALLTLSLPLACGEPIAPITDDTGAAGNGDDDIRFPTEGEGEGDAPGEGEGEGEGDGAEGEGEGEGDGAVDDEPRPFTLLDINLLHGFPTGQQLEERTQIVIDAIIALQPDAVAVQEASESSSYDNIAGAIADAVGYEWTWQRAAGFGDVFNEGPGVLSRWPITASSHAQLEGTGDGLTGRVCVRATLETPYGAVNVTSIHAGGDDASSVNIEQVAIAYQFVASSRTTLPGFLAGDMNAEPDELGMRFLRGEAEHEGTTGDMLDAWLVVNPDDPGFTSDAASPDGRIDYVYVLPGTATAGTVQHCEIMFDEPVGGLLASDHLGVLCSFDLR